MSRVRSAQSPAARAAAGVVVRALLSGIYYTSPSDPVPLRRCCRASPPPHGSTAVILIIIRGKTAVVIPRPGRADPPSRAAGGRAEESTVGHLEGGCGSPRGSRRCDGAGHGPRAGAASTRRGERSPASASRFLGRAPTARMEQNVGWALPRNDGSADRNRGKLSIKGAHARNHRNHRSLRATEGSLSGRVSSGIGSRSRPPAGQAGSFGRAQPVAFLLVTCGALPQDDWGGG